MGLFSTISHKMEQSRFKKRGLAILENVPKKAFVSVLQEFIEQGWEVDYHSTDVADIMDSGNRKLRKGQTAIEFHWQNEDTGTIVGIKRVLVDIAKAHELELLDSPSAK